MKDLIKALQIFAKHGDGHTAAEVILGLEFGTLPDGIEI